MSTCVNLVANDGPECSVTVDLPAACSHSLRLIGIQPKPSEAMSAYPAWIGGTGGQGGWDMTVQLLVEVVIIAVVIYVAVRFFRRRG